MKFKQRDYAIVKDDEGNYKWADNFDWEWYVNKSKISND